MHGPKPKLEITKEGKLPITKIDAAVRQLETAITLWFHDGDPVSICTLTHAAYEILYQIGKPTRKRPAMLDAHGIKPEFQKEIRAMFKAGADFSKHAGKDPHETHFFSVKSQPMILFDAVCMYHELGLGRRPLFRVFADWFWLTEPRAFTQKAQDVLGPNTNVEDVVAEGKQAYFQSMLPVYTRLFSGAGSPSGGHM